MNQSNKYLEKNYWDTGKIALLGTMSDAALAKHLGIKWTSVFEKRKSLGIASFRKFGPQKWNQKAIRMLGKKSDQEVANIFEMAKTTVFNKRKSLGITSSMQQSDSWHRWTEEEVAKLGKCKDKEVAERMNVEESCVSSKRRSLGIKAYHTRGKSRKPRPNAVEWTRHNLELLGKQPDKRVCEIMGICRKSVMRKRRELGIESYAVGTQYWHQWTEGEIARLGTITDRELAEQLGVETMCVTMKRRLLGIEPLTKGSKTKRPHVWEKQEIALLGKKPDSEIAPELGVSIGSVRKKRIQMGIATHCGARNPDIWTPEILARLGKVPLQKIADEIGVTREAVRQKCVKLGITTRFGKR